jgi:hypothetical protein
MGGPRIAGHDYIRKPGLVTKRKLPARIVVDRESALLGDYWICYDNDDISGDKKMYLISRYSLRKYYIRGVWPDEVANG